MFMTIEDVIKNVISDRKIILDNSIEPRINWIVEDCCKDAIEQRDKFWIDIIMKKLYNEDNCNIINKIFNKLK